VYRQLKQHAVTVFAASAAADMTRASDTPTLIGFSTKTWQP
jgi:hypothetical protein